MFEVGQSHMFANQQIHHWSICCCVVPACTENLTETDAFIRRWAASFRFCLKGLSFTRPTRPLFFSSCLEQHHGPGPRGGVQNGLQTSRPGAYLQPGAVLLAPGAQRQARDQCGPLQLREKASWSKLNHEHPPGALVERGWTIWRNSSAMLLIPFYLSIRLRELHFEVKVYENYKQEEVLDKIGEGLHSEVR